ncbi:MAG TPA: transglutaminase family protein, partial [Candidatus Bathyarchaeota archaeon]|nr:transglutaminase family protein [Candidatus Bathyarchaeota archaeon]
MTTEKARLAALLLQVLITTAMLSTPTANTQKPKIVQFTLQNKLTYINDGSHVWNLTKEDASISLFLNNSWQTVAVEDVSHQIIEVDVDEDGNPIAYLNIEKWTLAPGENITIQVSYEITSMPRTLPEITLEASGTLKDIPERLKEEFCEDEGCWLTKNQTLRELAQNLTGSEENVLAIVCNFVSWINENIDYKSFDTPLYPNETYQLRQGDCDDQANLLITLCRIVGIPAYLQVGCVYVMGISEETTWSGHLELLEVNVGWHGWATVYIPPWGWLPVDLTYSDFPATQN